MSSRSLSRLHLATLVMTILFPAWSTAQTAQEYGGTKDDAAKTGSRAAQTATGYGGSQGSGGSQGYSGSQASGGSQGVGAETVVCPGGCYGGGRIRNYCRGVYSGAGYYGFFRRYYGYPFYGPSYPVASQSFDFGGCPISGIVYSSGYGSHCAGLGGHGPALPIHDGPQGGASPGGTSPSSAPANTPAATPAKESPRPDNAAHLELLVPEKAEVLIDDGKTMRTGTVREFVSPPLAPGKSFLYKITVRYTDTNGAKIDEEHSIHVHANDQLRMDFTSPRQHQEVASGGR